jgi:hypothetical protein
MKSNHTSGPGQRHRLRDHLLGLGNGHKDKPGGDEVEGPLRQAGGARVSGYDFDVSKTTLGEKGLSQRDRIRADLDADDSSRRTHPRGEQIEAAARTAPDLQDAGTLWYSDLIEQTGRLMTEFLGLALQTLLLGLPIAKDVMIPTGHVCLL